MKTSHFSSILLFILCQVVLASAQSQSLPDKKSVLKVMRSTNSYFMHKWPDPGKPIVTNKERPSNIWTRAVYYEGLMALYNVEAKNNYKRTYYNYAVEWGEKHSWGLRDGISTRNADNQACGQTYIDLYLLDKKPERINDIKASIDSMVNSTKSDDWDWIDAIQMAMPVFAHLGVIYNDNRYFDKMYDLYRFSKLSHGGNGLWNPTDKLWWRDKDFVPPYKEPNGEDCYWSRGNGWVVAALVRTLALLPKSNTHYNEFLQDYKDMMQALLPIQRSDGFWNVSLHDPNHFGGRETTGTALFVYGMAWGLNNGILKEDQYRNAAVRGWDAIAKHAVHANGKLGYVQGTGKEPKDGQPVGYDITPDFEDYGLGCVLLAGSEVYKLK